MPTLLLLDVSLSMSRPVQGIAIEEGSEAIQVRQLAVNAINTLLDYLALHTKLEFVSLVSCCYS